MFQMQAPHREKCGNNPRRNAKLHHNFLGIAKPIETKDGVQTASSQHERPSLFQPCCIMRDEYGVSLRDLLKQTAQNQSLSRPEVDTPGLILNMRELDSTSIADGRLRGKPDT